MYRYRSCICYTLTMYHSLYATTVNVRYTSWLTQIFHLYYIFTALCSGKSTPGSLFSFSRVPEIFSRSLDLLVHSLAQVYVPELPIFNAAQMRFVGWIILPMALFSGVADKQELAVAHHMLGCWLSCPLFFVTHIFLLLHSEVLSLDPTTCVRNVPTS